MPSIVTNMLGACVIVPILASAAPGAFAGELVEGRPPTQETTPGEQPQRTCLPHHGIDARLRHDFGEKILGRGISNDGTLLEIFIAQDGRTFTVIKTTPQGLSCVVDFGDDWQPLNQIDSVGFRPDDLKVTPTPF